MAAAEKRKPGRPTTYVPETVEAILEHLEAGLCASEIADLEGMPTVSTMSLWREKHAEFSEAYARAFNAGVLRNEAELLREARRKPVDSVDATAQRTLVDTLKWRLSKRLPKDFGDRQQVEHSGSLSLGDAIARTAARRAAEQSEPES